MSAILLNSHSHRRRSDHFLCALLDCSLKGRLRPHALQPLMVSQRSLRLHTWWWKDHNPGRHLVLAPFNGATAASGTPYFTENPGDPRKAWDASAPSITCPANTSLSAGSLTIGAASVPYFSGKNRIAPPGGNTGSPGFVGFGFYPGSAQRREPAEPGDFGQVSGGKTESYKKFVKMNVHRLTTSAVSDRLIRAARQMGRREAGSGWADGIQYRLSCLP